jgi:hypothetical protein
VPYDPLRRVEIIDHWPIAVSECARGKSEESVMDCYTYQERSELGLIRPFVREITYG